MSQNISNSGRNISTYQYNPYILQQQQSFSAGTPVSNGKVVESNPLLNAATSTPDNPAKMLAAMGLSAAALIPLNNVINKPLIEKEYEKTFFAKIEKYIDKHLSSKSWVKNLNKKAENFRTAFQNKVNNSEILRTLFKKPSVAGPMAQQQANGSIGHMASRAVEIMQKYKNAHPEFTGYDSLITKGTKAKFESIGQIRNYMDDVVRTIKNSGVSATEVITKKPKWGLGIIKNKTSLQEIINKYDLIKKYKFPGATAGGKASGFLLRGTECLTNGIFAGIGSILMQAIFIGQSVSEASKAEKGEKFSTFMASLSELMAFMATMGIQMRTVNHLAGLKFMGMPAADVAKYRKAVKIANEAAKYGNHKAYNKMAILIKNLEQNAKRNVKWYQKPIKWIGNIFGYGRVKETLKPLKSGKFATALAKIPNKLKIFTGFSIRTAFIMAVLTPIISGLAKKASYAIFGKPVKTLEKQKAQEEADKAASQQQEQVSQQQAAQTQTQQPVQPQQTVNTVTATSTVQNMPQQQAVPGNLMDTMNRMQQPQNTIASQSIMNQAAPASTSISPDAGIKRTYIPNPILGPENQQSLAATRTARIDAVLRQADYAEAMAQRFI